SCPVGRIMSPSPTSEMPSRKMNTYFSQLNHSQNRAIRGMMDLTITPLLLCKTVRWNLPSCTGFKQPIPATDEQEPHRVYVTRPPFLVPGTETSCNTKL